MQEAYNIVQLTRIPSKAEERSSAFGPYIGIYAKLTLRFCDPFHPRRQLNIPSCLEIRDHQPNGRGKALLPQVVQCLSQRGRFGGAGLFSRIPTEHPEPAFLVSIAVTFTFQRADRLIRKMLIFRNIDYLLGCVVSFS